MATGRLSLLCDDPGLSILTSRPGSSSIMVFYVGFLLLYAIILLTHLPFKRLSSLDGVLLVWIVSFFVEEVYQFVTSITTIVIDNPRIIDFIKNFYSDKWNILDTFALFGFVLGFTLRLIPVFKPYEAGRLILSIDFICFSWRLLHIFTITKSIGPMLVMIWKMLMDLVPFLVILIVSVMSFAVASEAIMYPNTPWSLQFVLFLPKKAFFSIFGEFFMDEIEATDTRGDCTEKSELWRNGTEPRCPASISKYAVPLLMSIYIIFTNVLLLNIIIARFNFTFQTIHEFTDELWAWQNIRLTLDYDSKPPVPPPFTLIWRFIQLCSYCYYCCRRKDTRQDSREANGGSPTSDPNDTVDGRKGIRKDNHLSVKRTLSDTSEKAGDNDNDDIGLRSLNRADMSVKVRSRTDQLKSMSPSSEVVPQIRIDDDGDYLSLHDDEDMYSDDDNETETIGDFERSMGEIHLAVRPDGNMRKRDHAEIRTASVIRPSIRMKRITSRESDA